MALARDGRALATFDGQVEGRVIGAERGADGFGYDALFVPAGFEQTFGELSSAVKNTLSHRARAVAQAANYLRRMPE